MLNFVHGIDPLSSFPDSICTERTKWHSGQTKCSSTCLDCWHLIVSPGNGLNHIFTKTSLVYQERFGFRKPVPVSGKNHMQKFFFFFGEKWDWWQWDRDSVAKFKKCCFSDETEPSWVRIRPVNHDQKNCPWHWELRKSRATRGLVALVDLNSCVNTEILWLWVDHWWKTSWPWPASAWCHRYLA